MTGRFRRPSWFSADERACNQRAEAVVVGVKSPRCPPRAALLGGLPRSVVRPVVRAIGGQDGFRAGPAFEHDARVGAGLWTPSSATALASVTIPSARFALNAARFKTGMTHAKWFAFEEPARQTWLTLL